MTHHYIESKKSDRRFHAARKISTLALAVTIGVLSCQVVQAQQPPTTSTTLPTTDPAVARTPQQILTEFSENNKALEAILPEQSVLRDSAAREKIAPQALPILRKLVGLLDELAGMKSVENMSPESLANSLAVQRLQIEPVLIAFGDAAAKEQSATRGKSKDPLEAALGRGDQVIANYLVAPDEASQLKVVSDLETFLKENPSNTAVDLTAALMLIHPAASGAVTDQLLKVTKATPPGPMTENVSMQVESTQKQKTFENKPMVLEAKLLDGKPFTTADWKGKVVLVDFWATWCGPCLAELPRVKETYKKYHEQGLEILGVSNDHESQALSGFLTKNPDMPWPQVFDPAAAAQQDFHPLATSHSIIGIPTMYIIDRKGVLRSVEGRRTMEELIPKLIAEPAN